MSPFYRKALNIKVRITKVFLKSPGKLLVPNGTGRYFLGFEVNLDEAI